MPPSCPLAQGGGGFRGPPPPLILAPIIYQLVRRSCDPKMVAYVKELVAKEGPQAVAANAHKIVQYTLSKVPANVLYWFTSRVLNLPPEAAMQTTEFLKSRTEIEVVMGEAQQQQQIMATPQQQQLKWETSDGSLAMTGRGWNADVCSTSDIERRLERLEMDYQALQEKHYESMKLLTSKSENMYLPRELPMPDSEESRAQAVTWAEEESSTELVKMESQSFAPGSDSNEVDCQALLQNVGLRVGRVFLEWAGDTIKQTLVSAAAAKASANQPLAGAGADLAGRLVDAIIVRDRE